MLHPFAPFVTEELWQHLRRAGAASAGRFAPPEGWGEALITAAWPEAGAAAQEEGVEQFEVVREIVTAIRNARAEKDIPATTRLAATFAAGAHTGLLESQRALLASLGRLAPEGILIREELAIRPTDAIPLVVGSVEIYLHSVRKVDRQAESLRLQKELADAEAQIDRLRKLLASEFATRAPAPVVEKERARLAELEQARARLAEQLQGL